MPMMNKKGEDMEGMEAIITSVTALVTAAIGWMGQIVDFVVAEPLTTLFVVAIPLVGLGIGYLRRLIG